MIDIMHSIYLLKPINIVLTIMNTTWRNLWIVRDRIAMYLYRIYRMLDIIISNLQMFLITNYNSNKWLFFRKFSACYWNFSFKRWLLSILRVWQNIVFFKFNHNNMMMIWSMMTIWKKNQCGSNNCF